MFYTAFQIWFKDVFTFKKDVWLLLEKIPY